MSDGNGTSASTDARTTETLVIGAGPSGLAVAGSLRHRGLEFDLLEASDAVGSTWRNHYHRLHLHTVKKHSALPHRPFPAAVPRFVSRARFVEYLDTYAEQFNIEPLYGQRVTEARPVAEPSARWHVETDSGEWRCWNLVVATGYNRVPKVPSWPGRDRFEGQLLHSCDYKDGTPYRGQRVLVVGIGNSGGEIAVDLVEHGAAAVAICVRGHVRVVPREVLGVSAQEMSIVLDKLPDAMADAIVAMMQRVVFEDLSDYGLRPPPYNARVQVERYGKVPLIDVGTVDLVKNGSIRIVGDVAELVEDGVILADDEHLALDAIVCATGYRAQLDDFLADAERYVDDRGYPTVHGAEAQAPGLYFTGFRNPVTGALRESAIEAERIADDIFRKRAV